MKVLICSVLLVISTVVAKPVAESYAQDYAHSPYDGSYYVSPVVAAVTSSQYHAQSEAGEYSFGYNNPNSAKSEIKRADGVVQGSYSYIDANGILQTTNYIADDILGFRVAATNLPVAPAASAPAAPAVVAPTVAYSYLPYATKYAYTMPSVAATPAVAPVQASAVPAATQKEEALIDLRAAVPVAAVPVAAAPEVAPVEVKAAPATLVNPVIAAPIKTQFHVQDEFGQYKFGYSEPTADRVETKTADGTVTGTYNYVDSDGKIQTVHYVADHLGFRVAGTNLPIAHHAAPVAAPTSVAELPEVVAARIKHLQAVEDAKKVVPVIQAPEVKAVPAALVKEEEVAVPVIELRSTVNAEPARVTKALVGVPVAAPVTYAVAAPVQPASNQHHSQDEVGQYSYGYNNQNSAKLEHKLADGSVRGTYSYVDAHGLVQRVDYISDDLGFRVAATNLPVAPAAAPVPVVSAQAAPAPVEVKNVPASQATLNSVPVTQAIVNPAPVAAQVAVPVQTAVVGPYASSYGYAQPVVSPITSSQYHAQSEAGEYSFGYNNPNSAKSEIKSADGVVRGSYSYVDANGVLQTANYISDDIYGFRVAATNLPVAPAA